jgi:lipopolysaccharide transport system permease protein
VRAEQLTGLQLAWPWHHRELIWQFARKDVAMRYRGAWLGLGWAFAAPAAMLIIYTLVFRDIFGARWPGLRTDSPLDFALYLFAGLIVFGWVSESLSRAPRLILDQPQLVTKMVFPLPLLAWASVAASLFQLTVSMLIWLIACVMLGYTPSMTWLYLPFIVLSLLPWLLGLSWILSSLGVYLRDLSQIVGLVLSGMIFLTPVFYPITALPNWIKPVLSYNPMAAPIEALRACVLTGANINIFALSSVFLSGLCIASLGVFVFHRIRGGFADVL